MPTSRRRTQLTHTTTVERALAVAGRRWPGERQSTLLHRLIEAGADSIEATVESDRERRRRKAIELSTKYRGTLAADHLASIRAEWPE